MELKTVKLATADFENFLAGIEVFCPAPFPTPNEGEKVMVLRDSTANHTAAGVPTRERQSDYIGVQGIVTHVTRGAEPGIMILKQ